MRRADGWWWAAFGVAVVIQLVALYAPSTPAVGPDLPHVDKVQHAVSFALVAFTGVLAGIRARWLVPVLLGHAVLSEVVQGAFLAERSGDALDVVADTVGLLVGWAGAELVLRRRTRAHAPELSAAEPARREDVR